MKVNEGTKSNELVVVQGPREVLREEVVGRKRIYITFRKET